MGRASMMQDSVITPVDTRVSVNISTVRCVVHVCLCMLQNTTVTPCSAPLYSGVWRRRRFCAIQFKGGGYGVRHSANTYKMFSNILLYLVFSFNLILFIISKDKNFLLVSFRLKKKQYFQFQFQLQLSHIKQELRNVQLNCPHPLQTNIHFSQCQIPIFTPKQNHT
jgi:hypothetical protein